MILRILGCDGFSVRKFRRMSGVFFNVGFCDYQRIVVVYSVIIVKWE